MQQIQVEGNYTGETREIIDQSALVSGESIWSQSLGSAKERVEQIPYIEEATIERSSRQHYALLSKNGSYGLFA